MQFYLSYVIEHQQDVSSCLPLNRLHKVVPLLLLHSNC
jgi:hypothetical protein